MNLCFTLTMPGVKTWNGTWSGAENLYARVVSFRGKKDIEARLPLAGRCFDYDFGDGWRASVSVREIDGREVRKVRKASRGFCGYEWMIDSILKDGRIIGPTTRKAEEEAAQKEVASHA